MDDLEARARRFLSEQWGRAPLSADRSSDLAALLRTMTSGKWRRSALDDESRADIQAKIEGAVSAGVAIEFSVPFGGYKSWTLPSYPHLNWADVFAVSFLRRFGEEVARQGGWNVAITFSYCSGVMDLVNNMSLKDQSLYTNEFTALLREFSDPGVEMSLFDVASQFPSTKALRDRLREGANALADHWEAMDPEARNKRLQSAGRNLQRNGLEDLRDLEPKELAARVERSAIFCEALDSLPERRAFNKFSSRIQLVHVRGPKPSIHLASCDTSSNHFGVGDGVVEVRRDRCLQRIITGGLPEGAIPVNLHGDDQLTRGFPGLRMAHLLDATDMS